MKLLGKRGACMETRIGQAAGQGGSLVPSLSVCPHSGVWVVRTFRGYISERSSRQRTADAVYCSNDSVFSRNGQGRGETT